MKEKDILQEKKGREVVLLDGELLRRERGIRFVPLYEVGYDPYSIYFPVKEDR